MEAIIDAIEKNYDIKINYLEKIKNVYRIYGNDQCYCLKLIRYHYPHFKFILAAMEHLYKKGFDGSVPILSNNHGEKYISFKKAYGYLTPWVNARESNYDNPYDLAIASSTLGKLHIASEGFKIEKDMEPRVGWFRWIKTFKTRALEIEDFRRRINQKARKSSFDMLYLSMMEKELIAVERSITALEEGNYKERMLKDVYKRGFCHHDFAHHNVLIGNNNQVNIIDFDYCILDSNLHDLSSLLIRAMKNGKWDMEKLNLILDSYRNVKEIKQDDIPLMAAFMDFPQDYWQVGIQYYWEQQEWGEKFFLSKLI